MLKPLPEVFESDPRFRNMVVGTPSDFRLITVADHHEHIAAIELNADVAPRVRDAFERARNAYLYAWFVYDLTPLAQSQGYAALEMALRDRLGERKPNGKKWGGMKELLHAAQTNGLFDQMPLPGELSLSDRAGYGEALIDMIRHFRNELAHGSGYLNIPGTTLDALGECAAIINHLYQGDGGSAEREVKEVQT